MKTLSIQKNCSKVAVINGIMYTNFYNIRIDYSFDIFLLLMYLFDLILILQISLYFFPTITCFTILWAIIYIIIARFAQKM